MIEAKLITDPLAVTVKEACRLCSISHVTLYALMKEGRVKHTKVGRRTLVSYESLRDLLGVGAPTHGPTHGSSPDAGLRRRTVANTRGK